MTDQEQIRDYLIKISMGLVKVVGEINLLLDIPEDITLDDINNVHDTLTKEFLWASESILNSSVKAMVDDDGTFHFHLKGGEI